MVGRLSIITCYSGSLLYPTIAKAPASAQVEMNLLSFGGVNVGTILIVDAVRNPQWYCTGVTLQKHTGLL